MSSSEGHALKRLEQRLKEKTACIWAPWEYSGVVYHYTGCLGMKGILESSSLWLTRINDFDDERETLHGQRLIEAVERRMQYFECPTVFEDEDRWQQILCNSFHAACFSTDGDKESQWNRYADGGCGCAIEFDHRLLLRNALERKDALFRMVYDDSSKIDIIEQQLRVAEQTAPPYSEHWRSLQQTVLLQLINSACRFKQAKYSEEQEVRLFRVLQQSEMGKRKTRFSRSAWIHYVEWPFPRAALKGVVLGPHGDQDKRESALRGILDRNGWKNIKFTRSVTPVRS